MVRVDWSQSEIARQYLIDMIFELVKVVAIYEVLLLLFDR